MGLNDGNNIIQNRSAYSLHTLKEDRIDQPNTGSKPTTELQFKRQDTDIYFLRHNTIIKITKQKPTR